MAEVIKRKNKGATLIVDERELWIILSGLHLYNLNEPISVTGIPFDRYELADGPYVNDLLNDIHSR